MKWHKKLLLTVSGIIILFTVSLCLLNNIYDQRLWEEIVFLKPNGDDKPGIILVLFFVLIAQMIQNYVHMGRCARKELSILIAGKIDKRKWLIEKNKEMYMRGLLLAAISAVLVSMALGRIPDIAFWLFYLNFVLLLSQLAYSETFLAVLYPDSDIPVMTVLIPAVLTVIDSTKNLGLIVYTGSAAYEGIRLALTVILWALMDAVNYLKLKKSDIF